MEMDVQISNNFLQTKIKMITLQDCNESQINAMQYALQSERSGACLGISPLNSSLGFCMFLCSASICLVWYGIVSYNMWQSGHPKKI